ncbi:hypothetical protein BDW59DRAFT_34785 [Aspergillus cavernicola]|uniref:NAD(P)-binding domain-containing protein n=1 Tax=Aspergillus cavernicola TaxID=176166 RepID=A0ABR4HCI1_9EURO
MSIAIAGSGDVTRYLTEELGRANLPVVILSRREKPQFDLPGVTQQVVDYNSVPSLVAALNDNNAVALISTILDYNPDSFIAVHKNLIKAAQQSTQCKRFIPSEYGVNIEEYPDQPGFYYETREPIRQLLREQSDLEWTLVCCGWLVDYIIPSRNRYLRDIGDSFPINLADTRMVIPGTGKEAVDLVAARDLANALAALVQAPKGTWEPYIYISGEQTSFNKVGGQVKEKYPQLNFDVQYLSLRTLVNGVRDAKDDFERIDAEYKIVTVSNSAHFDPAKVQRHREKYFAGVHFRSVQEILDAPDVIV